MATITDNDLKMFQERARNELTGRGTGSIAWDSVIWDLCHEVRKLRSASKERGDAAKLREALAPFPSLCDWLVVNASKLGIPDMVAKLRKRGDKARAALAAPPRNCDRFASVDEARKAHEAICEKYGKCHHGCPLNNEEHYSAFDCFEAWLFAPATAQEGGAE